MSCVVLSGCKREHAQAVLAGALRETPASSVSCLHYQCVDGKCGSCEGKGVMASGWLCADCYGLGYCDLCEGEGEYPPGFDIEAVLRNGKVYLSFKETTGCVCGGSGACVMRGGSVNKTMPPAMAAGLLGASGSLCAGCMDTWRRQACSGTGLRRVPDFGVKASRP